MTITNKNTNGTRTIPLGEREVMQELTPADVNFGKIRVGTNGTYAGEVLLAKDADVVSNTLAISTLGSRVTTTEGNISSLNTTASGLNSRLNTAESNITGLSSAVGDLISADTALDGRLDTIESTLTTNHIGRADKYLAAQDVAAMIYSSGNLSKIQYNTATDSNYEVLSYSNGSLAIIQHYVGAVLKGTTTLGYTAGVLTSAVFTGV